MDSKDALTLKYYAMYEGTINIHFAKETMMPFIRAHPTNFVKIKSVYQEEQKGLYDLELHERYTYINPLYLLVFAPNKMVFHDEIKELVSYDQYRQSINREESRNWDTYVWDTYVCERPYTIIEFGLDMNDYLPALQRSHETLYPRPSEWMCSFGSQISQFIDKNATETPLFEFIFQNWLNKYADSEEISFVWINCVLIRGDVNKKNDCDTTILNYTERLIHHFPHVFKDINGIAFMLRYNHVFLNRKTILNHAFAMILSKCAVDPFKVYAVMKGTVNFDNSIAHKLCEMKMNRMIAAINRIKEAFIAHSFLKKGASYSRVHSKAIELF